MWASACRRPRCDSGCAFCRWFRNATSSPWSLRPGATDPEAGSGEPCTPAAASKRDLHLQPDASTLRSVHRAELALDLRDHAGLLHQRRSDIGANRIHAAGIAIAVDRCIILDIVRCLAIQEAIDTESDGLRNVIAAAKLKREFVARPVVRVLVAAVDAVANLRVQIDALRRRPGGRVERCHLVVVASRVDRVTDVVVAHRQASLEPCQLMKRLTMPTQNDRNEGQITLSRLVAALVEWRERRGARNAQREIERSHGQSSA